MGVVERVAGPVVEGDFTDLAGDEVHQIKRLLLDTLACAYGGLDSSTVAALMDGGPLLGDRDEATVIRAARRYPALNAVLLNGAMVRFLDMNDVQQSPRAPGPRHGHNSEFFPLVLALAEREGRSGEEVITSAWWAYEVSTRFTEGVIGDSLEHRGWNLDLRAGFVAPVIAGRLLGLRPRQIQDAVGISMSRGMLLQAIDHSAEINSMAKNLRVPLGCCHGLIAAYLAGAGLTGPARALEGGGGFVETVLQGDFDTEHLLDSRPQGSVKRAVMKRFAACFATHGHLSATLELVLEHDLRPRDIVTVDIRTTTRGANHTGDPARRHPDNKETADHSSYYVTAALIACRELGPAQYSEQMYADPEIRRLADAVTIAPEPAYDQQYPAASVRMTLADGSTVERFVGVPPGHPDNPLRDAEIEAKFRSLSAGQLTEAQASAVIAATWRLDELSSAADYLRIVAGEASPG